MLDGDMPLSVDIGDVVLGSSRVFVLPSSSGADADRRNFAPKSSKAEWWRELGDLRSLTA
jgi:hypothetical protein